MKKLVLIIGIVLCIAIIGSVFAIAVYDARDIEGTVGTDTYLYLTLDTTASTGVQLEKGVPTIIPIVLGIDTNETGSWGSATMTVKATEQEGKKIDKVEITLWANSSCTQAIDGLSAGTNEWTLTGITTGRTIYVKLVLSDDATEADIKEAGGNLNVKLVKAA